MKYIHWKFLLILYVVITFMGCSSGTIYPPELFYGAKDIRVHKGGSGQLGADGIFLAKGRIDEAQYYSNISSSKYVEYDHVAHGQYRVTFSFGGVHVEWWDPPEDMSGVYFQHHPGRDKIDVVRYSGGYIYYALALW